MNKKIIEQAIQDLKEGKYDEQIAEYIKQHEHDYEQQVLRQMSERIPVDNLPWVQKWADIKVFEGEPYTPDTYVPEFLHDYLVGLEYLRQTFNRDKNMDVYNALMALMPVGLYFDRYDDAN